MELSICELNHLEMRPRQNFIVLFLCTAPFTLRSQNTTITKATVDCLTNNKTKNALQVILNYIVWTKLAIAWVNSPLETYCKGDVNKKGNKILPELRQNERGFIVNLDVCR